MDRRAEGVAALRPGYVLATLALFTIEVLIALFVRDGIVRPYLGDVLAVALVYTALRTVTPLRMVPAIAAALAVAFAVEIAQWFRLVDLLGLAGNPVARVVLGSYFSVGDLAAYLAGAACVLAVERLLANRSTA